MELTNDNSKERGKIKSKQVRSHAISFSLIIGVVFFLQLNIARAQEIQFEDYRWGSSIEEVKKQIERKGHVCQTEPDCAAIGYIEEILGEVAEVVFAFTPKTDKLASIRISWESEDLVKRLAEFLITKYGEPKIKNETLNEFCWHDDMSVLGLRYVSMETELVYFSKKYSASIRAEQQELDEEEIKDKF